MAYTDFNVSLYRGTRQRWQVPFTLVGSGDPFDLTGCTIWCTAKVALTTDVRDIIFTLSTLDGSITFTNFTGSTAAVDGIATITIEPEDTINVREETVAFCDVQLRDSHGNEGVLLTGMVTVLLHPTQSY